METLFLAHRIPFPPNRGDKIRSWRMLETVARFGPVHLACFADDEADVAHLPALREALGGRLGEVVVERRTIGRATALRRALSRRTPTSLEMFASRKLKTFVDRILRDRTIATIFAFSSQMAQFVPVGAPRFIMDFVDVDSAKFAAYAQRGQGPLAWLYAREARLLADYERKVAARTAASLFVSEPEAALFRTGGGANAIACANGVDLDFFDPGRAYQPIALGEAAILFTGQMDYQPNIDAVAGFAREVMPLVRAARPDASFAIAGRNPAPAVQRLSKLPGVIVTGAVPDVRPWLAGAVVVTAPLRVARGIQNKVLEAMAMARPVIATPAAFEGIEAVPERDLIVAGDARAQADAVLALLADPARAARIGAAARRRMEEGYRWEDRLAPIRALIASDRLRAAA